MKIYEYIDYLKRDLIKEDICRVYSNYNNFNIQFCLNQCKNRECVDKNKISAEFTKIKDIEEEISKNQFYIQIDIRDN